MTHTHFTNGMHSPESERRLLAFAVNKTAKEAPKESDVKGAEGDKDLYDTARKNVEHFQRVAQNYLKHDFVDEKTKKTLTSKIAKLHDNLNAKLDENCAGVMLKEREYEGALRQIENMFSRLEAENPDLYDVQPYNERMQQKWEGAALKSGKLVAAAYADGKYVLDFPERWKLSIPGKPHDVSQSRHRAEFDRADIGATVRVDIPGKKPYDAPVTEGENGALVLDLSGVENLATTGDMSGLAEKVKPGGADGAGYPEEFMKEGELPSLSPERRASQELAALNRDVVEGMGGELGSTVANVEGMAGESPEVRAILDRMSAQVDKAVSLEYASEGGNINKTPQEVAQEWASQIGELTQNDGAKSYELTWDNGFSLEEVPAPVAAEEPREAAPGKSPEAFRAEAETQLQLGKDFLKDIQAGDFALDDEGINRIEGQVSTMRVIMREMQDAGADAALGEEGERLSSELISVAAALEATLPKAPTPAAPETTEDIPTLEEAQAQLQELLKEADFAVRNGTPETALDEVNRYIEGMRDKDAELHGSLLMLAVDGRTFERPVTGDSYAIALDGDTLVLRKVEAKTDNPELEQAKNRYAMIRGMLDGLAAKVDGGDLSALSQLRTDAQDAVELRRRDIQDRSKEAGVDPKTDALMTELRTQMTELQNDYIHKYRDLQAPAKGPERSAPAPKKGAEATDKPVDPMPKLEGVSQNVENRRLEASSAYYMLYTEITQGRGYDAQLQDLNASSKGFEQTLKDGGYDVAKYYEGVAAKLPQKFPQADGTLLTLTFDAKSRTFSVEKGVAAAAEAEKKSPEQLRAATDEAYKALIDFWAKQASGVDLGEKGMREDPQAVAKRVGEVLAGNPEAMRQSLALFKNLHSAIAAELNGVPDLQKTNPGRHAKLVELKTSLDRAIPQIDALQKIVDEKRTGKVTAKPGEAAKGGVDTPAQAEFSDKDREDMKKQALEMINGAKPLGMTQKEIDKLVGRVQMTTGVSVTVNLAANSFDTNPPTTNFEKLMNHVSGFVQFITVTFDKTVDNETLQQKRDKAESDKGKGATEKAEVQKAFEAQLAALENSPDGFGFTFTLEKGADGSQKLTLTRDDGKPLSPELLAKLKAAGMENGVVNKADAAALTKLDGVLKEGIPDKNMTMVDVIKQSPNWVKEARTDLTPRQYMFKNGLFVCSGDDGLFTVYEKTPGGTFDFVKKEGQQFNVEKGVFEPIPAGTTFSKTTRKWEVGLKAPEKKEDPEQQKKDAAVALAEAINSLTDRKVAIDANNWQATIESIIGSLNTNENSLGHDIGLWFNGDTLEEGEHAYWDFDQNLNYNLGATLRRDPMQGIKDIFKIKPNDVRGENPTAAGSLERIQTALRTKYTNIDTLIAEDEARRQAEIAAMPEPDPMPYM